MKNILVLAVLGLATVASTAHAARFTYSGSNGNYAFYLRSEGTVFNGVDFKVTPDTGQFQNLNGGLLGGVPRPAGFAATYRNRAIDLAVDDIDNPGIGKGWTLILPRVNATQVSITGGPLSGNISTAAEPNGRLFLANILLLPGVRATATITLVNGSTTVGQLPLEYEVDVPEPATLGMASVSVLGLATIRRRRCVR
jgi:hypothetical protein